MSSATQETRWSCKRQTVAILWLCKGAHSGWRLQVALLTIVLFTYEFPQCIEVPCCAQLHSIIQYAPLLHVATSLALEWPTGGPPPAWRSYAKVKRNLPWRVRTLRIIYTSLLEMPVCRNVPSNHARSPVRNKTLHTRYVRAERAGASGCSKINTQTTINLHLWQ